MDSNNSFKITYSAKKREEVEKIRSKYIEPENDKMRMLKELDETPERKARALSLTTGIIGILLFGLGMSLALSELGALLGGYAILVGAVSGALGLIMMISAHPLYHKRLKAERKKIAPEVIKLTDELLK